MCGKFFRSYGFAAGEFGLGAGELLWRVFPGVFQATGDQAGDGLVLVVVVVDGELAPADPAGRQPLQQRAAIGLSVSRTIRTAPSRNSRSKFRRCTPSLPRGDASAVRGEGQIPTHVAPPMEANLVDAGRCQTVHHLGKEDRFLMLAWEDYVVLLAMLYALYIPVNCRRAVIATSKSNALEDSPRHVGAAQSTLRGPVRSIATNSSRDSTPMR